jgi:predicted small secreted protein
MSNVSACSAPGSLLFFSALLLAISASGCSDASGVGRTVPVTGKVILQDAPLTAKTTIVLFKPDASRGNTSPFEPTGTVDADGNYTLATKGKNGAPPGWYKVIVTAREEAASVQPKNPKYAARSLLPAKYGRAETSGLSIEVVENPALGVYDLKLSK